MAFRTPSYRLHKPTGLAVVTLSGQDHYLGRHGSPESRAEYDRLIAEWLLRGRGAPPEAPKPIAPTVSELILAYWDRHVVPYYVKNGRPTSERDNIRQALRFVRPPYGHTPASDFGPLALKAVRQAMTEAGRCRRLINKDINRIRSMFRWAVEHELLPSSVHEALRAVAGLREGRSEARETAPVGPVPDEHVQAVLPLVPPPVAAMVQLQRLTGARPGEVASLRPCDIADAGDGMWTYRPREHKTEHHGRDRVIVLGPRAQEVLCPWLDRDPEAYCFAPAESTAWRNARLRTRREEGADGCRPRKARPRRVPGRRYSKDAYRVAIQRACRKAGVPEWTPLQLRHARATEIRAKFGLEAAQAVLGHSRPDTTLIYAEKDLGTARAVMAAIG
jgi:integrase